VVGVDRIQCHVASTSALRYRSVPTNLTSLLLLNRFQYLRPSLPAHVAILLSISSRAFNPSNRTVLTVQSSAFTRTSSSAIF
jgi:hypothetical protein